MLEREFVKGRVGKKFAIYLPKKIVKATNIKEGDQIRIFVRDGDIIIKVIKDPIDLALKGDKFATITAEEMEEISLKEQKKYESKY